MIRPLFDRYQKYILAFANTQFGKSYLDCGGMDYGEKIIRVTPDGIYFDENEQVRAIFHPRSQFLKKLSTALTCMKIVEDEGFSLKRHINKLEFIIPHFSGLIAPRSYLPEVNLLQFNPNAHPESTSMDGLVYSAWSTWKPNAGDPSYAVDGDEVNGLQTRLEFQTRRDSTTGYLISRVFTLFDTSSLPDTVNISKSNLKLYMISWADNANDANGFVRMITTSPASNTQLVGTDWGNVTTTNQSADVDCTGQPTGAYFNFPLNATGISNISKTGISKFGMREGNDIIGSTAIPANGYQGGVAQSSEDTNKPILEVFLATGGAYLYNFL